MKNKLFLVALVGLLVFTVLGCRVSYPPQKSLVGSGKIVVLEQQLTGPSYSLVIEDIFFDGAGVGSITIDEDLDAKVSLSTESNIADTISLTVKQDGAIYLRGNKNYRYSSKEFNITIGAPLTKAEINGGFTLELNLPSVEEFGLTVNGAVSGSLLFGQLDSYRMEINGASDLSLVGEASSCSVQINGAANVDALDFITRDSDIEINGAGQYAAYVTARLVAKVNGIGAITYAGSPAVVEKDIAGLGTIKQKGE